MKKQAKINQKDYQFYVVNTTTGKIGEGFEFKEDAQDNLKEYIREMPYLKGHLKVYTKRHNVQTGLNPDDNANWLDVWQNMETYKEEYYKANP